MVRVNVSVSGRNVKSYLANLFVFVAACCYFLVFPTNLASGQERVNISQPELQLINNQLIIKYNIAGSKPDDKFRVWIEVTDSSGNRIDARALSGDIGDNINDSSPKQIIWDLTADSVYMNLELSVEVFVTLKEAPKPVVSAIQEEAKTDSAGAKPGIEKPVATNRQPEAADLNKKNTDIKKAEAEEQKDNRKKEKKEENALPVKPVKLGSNLLLSSVVPGWGLTRLSNGKPYWLIGLVDYGCLASSIYLNRIAVSNYDKYLRSNEADRFDSYYNTGEWQYKASNALAWSAAAIWVADLGYTWIRASRLKRSALKSSSASFSVRSSYSNYANATMITFSFTF
jgi:F0F1-type ATP synthase assembly protein I